MSDGDVAASLDSLERLLSSMTDEPDAGAVEAWHASFRLALAGAEKGPQWPLLVDRAHALAQRLDLQANRFTAIRGAIGVELQKRANGDRALSAYKPAPPPLR